MFPHIQSSFQDALSRSVSNGTGELNVKKIAEIMNEGYVATRQETASGQHAVSVLLLEGLAKVRFSLSVVADVLKEQVSHHKSVTSVLIHPLIVTAQNICSDLNINIVDTSGDIDTTGPIVYLMRLLVRRYGMSCLEKVADTYAWVVPETLKSVQEVMCECCH